MDLKGGGVEGNWNNRWRSLPVTAAGSRETWGKGVYIRNKKNDKVISQGKNLSSLILDVIAGAGAGAGYTINGDDVFSRRVLSCEKHKELKYSR